MDNLEEVKFHLGKTKVPNLFWDSSLPSAWDIPVRQSDKWYHSQKNANTTMVDWFNHQTVYNLNNLGYRSDFDYTIESLDGKRIIAFFGCSDTFGQYADSDKTFTSIVANEFPNHIILNFGVCGASCSAISRIGVRTILALKNIEHVCTLWSPPALREFAGKNFKSGITATDKDNIPHPLFWDEIDWVSNSYEFHKNYNLLRHAAENNGSKFHDLHICRHEPEIEKNLISCGPYTAFNEDINKAIADYFIRKISNKLSYYEEKRGRSLT